MVITLVSGKYMFFSDNEVKTVYTTPSVKVLWLYIIAVSYILVLYSNLPII